MSDQDKLDAYNSGFYDAYDGHIKANPYLGPDGHYTGSPGDGDVLHTKWYAYEKGYREGVAEKERVGNE